MDGLAFPSRTRSGRSWPVLDARAPCGGRGNRAVLDDKPRTRKLEIAAAARRERAALTSDERTGALGANGVDAHGAPARAALRRRGQRTSCPKRGTNIGGALRTNQVGGSALFRCVAHPVCSDEMATPARNALAVACGRSLALRPPRGELRRIEPRAICERARPRRRIEGPPTSAWRCRRSRPRAGLRMRSGAPAASPASSSRKRSSPRTRPS